MTHSTSSNTSNYLSNNIPISTAIHTLPDNHGHSHTNLDTSTAVTDNIDLKTDRTQTTLATDVLIIGSGLSGLSVALNLPNSIKVTVLSKDRVTLCSSYYAQGGIAGRLSADDSVESHVNDTLIAGDGLCDADNTHTILQQGDSAIDWLCQQGVPFSKSENNDSLHLTQEGGHAHRRIAHAEDATGKHIMDTLLANVQHKPNIQLLSQHEAIELLTNDHSDTINNGDDNDDNVGDDDGDGTHAGTVHLDLDSTRYCHGAKVLNQQTNTLITIQAKAVVLASGGLGQLFKRTTAPSISVGDGVMMAWQAGCRLANLEFVQFHPTGLAMTDTEGKASSFLISEAVRGEGGMLFCPISGERFMKKIDKRAELAPRDIVARAIHQQGKSNGLGYVHLDITHRPSAFIKQHFPQIYQYCLQLGLDITKEPIPVAPSAHYSCGGVFTTADGMSDVIGLYAVGEVAYTGLHGANRLASNSLLECVVVGRSIAQHLNKCLTTPSQHKTMLPSTLVNSWKFPKAEMAIDTETTTEIVASEFQTDDCLPLFANSCLIQTYGIDSHSIENHSIKNHSIDSHSIKDSQASTQLEHQFLIYLRDNENQLAKHKQQVAQLKQLMNDSMGIVRSQEKLEQALSRVTLWQSELKTQQEQQSALSTISLNHIRWQRLILLAKLMLQSALARKESRGGHYRKHFLTKSELAKISLVTPRHRYR